MRPSSRTLSRTELLQTDADTRIRRTRIAKISRPGVGSVELQIDKCQCQTLQLAKLQMPINDCECALDIAAHKFKMSAIPTSSQKSCDRDHKTQVTPNTSVPVKLPRRTLTGTALPAYCVFLTCPKFRQGGLRCYLDFQSFPSGGAKRRRNKQNPNYV